MAYGTSIIRKSCKNQLKIASRKKETTKCTLLHRGIVLKRIADRYFSFFLYLQSLRDLPLTLILLYKETICRTTSFPALKFELWFYITPENLFSRNCRNV